MKAIKETKLPQAILWEIIWQVKKSLLFSFVDQYAFIQVPALHGCGLHKEYRRMGQKKTVEQPSLPGTGEKQL